MREVDGLRDDDLLPCWSPIGWCSNWTWRSPGLREHFEAVVAENGAMQDRNLAASVGAIERNVMSRRAGDLLAPRALIGDELADRYVRKGRSGQAARGDLRKTRSG